MPPKGTAMPTTEPVRNRCTCGHFPTNHMRVVPIGPAPGGSYRLDPRGPCAVCGGPACPEFRPAV